MRANLPAGSAAAGMPWHRTLIFAIACGLLVGNLYCSQPLLANIGATFGVGTAATGLVVMVTLLGYSAGLILLAPLGDLVENRRLILTILCGTILALIAAALTRSFAGFLAASLAIGLTSVAAQVLVPLAAHLADPAIRGRVVGQVMSGLLLGILLARAVAGILAGSFGWRAVYFVSATALVVLLLVLARALPERRPVFAPGYAALMRSLAGIFASEPILRRRAAYQATMFGSFSIFWTCVPFLLASRPLQLSQTQIGLFALAGAAGALVAPIAGRIGDAGHGRIGTGIALVLASAAFALTLARPQLWLLVLSAVLLDLGVQMTLVLGQQAIYALKPEERSRLNTLYIATFFLGGAAGSALSAAVYARGGWHDVALLGAASPALGFVFWLTERAAATPAVWVKDH